jgi:aminomethyltransferase
MSLNKTSLHQEHLNLKAKMAPFAGWDMPIQYTSVKGEVEAVRKSCGMFDVSHMGEFWVEGKECQEFIDHVITNEFKNLPQGKAVYSPLCDDSGQIIDDLIVYKTALNKCLICVNASNIEKDFTWLAIKAKQFDVKITNNSLEYSLIALQGPESVKHLSQLLSFNHDLPYYGVQVIGDVVLARTGYTGEDGFEIFANHSTIKQLWQNLQKMGVTPCGLAARDVLRLEVGYPLYGQDLNQTLTPLDCGLKWTVKMDKIDFIGKNALKNYAPKYKLIKLSMDKGVPRPGYKVYCNNELVGEVTSGTHSVVLDKGIAMALIRPDVKLEGKVLTVEIRNNQFEASYQTKAFVNGGHK